MPTAEIISIGSELLLGQIVDTNSAWMAQRLNNLGVDIYFKTTVGDNPDRMKDVINRALGRADIVITGGGLGPTQDDITREIIAEVAGRKLVLDSDLLDQMKKRFRNRGFIMTSNNNRQAYMPENAIPVINPNGTAPSFIVEDLPGSIFALPGVPFELKWLFENEVVPYLTRKFDLNSVITYRILKVTDLGESAVDDLIGNLIANSSNPTVGVLAHPGQVDVRIAAKAADTQAAMELIAPIESNIRKLLGHHVFASGDETMENAVGQTLSANHNTIAVYEDLTGGLVTERLQQGSPEYFMEGIIGNGPATMKRLLVSSRKPNEFDSLLEDPATLTEEIAWAIRSQTNADIGLAVHCVPGSGRPSENFGHGRTFMAITNGKKFKRRSYNFTGRGHPDRSRISMNALELVRTAMLNRFE
ncbi:MAG: CinA family nicotinamide mononucleotide deamidase-related protein [SAR202 cluster bacterium]|jgi:nicotinamide-nucleotide amidase|nr:CinA family nicotinamide mononucleotide deamidase-related protein [SAR202 cluster bacterium]